MPIDRRELSGKSVAESHVPKFLDFIDTLESRLEAIESSIGTGVITIPEDRYSTLGSVTGGTTVAAGSVLPATGGVVIPEPGATTWIRISGTDARIGDAVFAVYEGRRTALDTNPAQRILSAAGPGAPGVDSIPAGTIEIALNSANTDLNRVFWFLMRAAA
jgi:hypothetical protein